MSAILILCYNPTEPNIRGEKMSKSSFNEKWRYAHLGEQDWTEIDLPHDAMLAEERSADNVSGKNSGWYAGRDYVYEKRFAVPADWKDKAVLFEFEGVYRKPKVYLNGNLAGECCYGYTGFYVSADQFLRYGEENVVRVEAFNAEQPNSRWYSGAGIYRPVWLHVLPKEHIALNGIRIKTKSYVQPEIEVAVQTTGAGTVTIEIFDGENGIASRREETSGEMSVSIALTQAKLWSAESPYLYRCRVAFGADVREETFGIRLIECDAERGFLVNGRRVILRGACIHHDNGILGAVNHPFADARKIALLRESGYNAIRSAHNPCSKATLEACDRLGMFVMDEYADMWYIHKLKYDFADDFEREWRRDLKALVDKDYNHPSVIMYSIGNEVAETAQKKGVELTGQLAQYLHTLDDRPVTCGVNIFFNLLSSLGFGVYTDKKAEQGAVTPKKAKKKTVGSEFFNDLAGLLGATTMKAGATLPGCNAKTKDAFAALDVAGYNYGILRYKRDLKRIPSRVIVGSETFCSDARKFWLQAQSSNALIGDFVWSGMDYLGEVGIGAWEYDDYAPDFTGGVGWLTASAGRLDLIGRAGAETAYTKVAFDQEKIRLAAVRPDKAFAKHSPSAWRMSNAMESWSWEGCEGKKTAVEVYATGKTVELLLNGKKIGRKRVPKNARLRFCVRYRQGELIAVSYDAENREIGRASLRTAGSDTKLTLAPERLTVKQGELCYVRLQYTDGNGTIKPLKRGEIKVRAEGGKLLALGSASPYNERGYRNDTTDTYYGEALAIVLPDGAGTVRVCAESPYGSGAATIRCE